MSFRYSRMFGDKTGVDGEQLVVVGGMVAEIAADQTIQRSSAWYRITPLHQFGPLQRLHERRARRRDRLDGGDDGAWCSRLISDPLFFRLGETEALEPCRTRRSRRDRRPRRSARDAVRGASTDLDAHALDRSPAYRPAISSCTARFRLRTFGKAISRRRTLAFQHRPGGQQSQPDRSVVGESSWPIQLTSPAISPRTPPLATTSRRYGPERVDHVPAAAPTGRAHGGPAARPCGRSLRLRKRVALQRIIDKWLEIRQRACGQQASHAGADHNRMLTNMFHRNAPTLSRLQPTGSWLIREGSGAGCDSNIHKFSGTA